MEQIVQTLASAMWAHHLTIYQVFDAYASLDANPDVFSMSARGFAQFVKECRISRVFQDFCSPKQVDALFAQVASEDAHLQKKQADRMHRDLLQLTRRVTPQSVTRSEEAQAPPRPTPRPAGALARAISTRGVAFERSPSLNRSDFFHCLIQLAVMRYVKPNELLDVGEAVHRLLSHDVCPNVHLSLSDGNAFRRTHCYVEQTDDVLDRHVHAIRAIFLGYSRESDGSLPLMGLSLWKCLLSDVVLIDDYFTDRESTLAFIGSRMRVIDERDPITAKKISHLTFEDFLEALVRVADMKVLPTQEDVRTSPFDDVGFYYLDIVSRGPDSYSAWVRSCRARVEQLNIERRERGEPESSERQTIQRALESLLIIIIRTIEARQGEDIINSLSTKGIRSCAVQR